MVNFILVAAGVILMIVALALCFRIISITTIKKLQWQWYAMASLIIFFLIAYVAYLVLVNDSTRAITVLPLVAFILFFGAVFVVGVLSISYRLILALTVIAKENVEANIQLTKNSESLRVKQKALEDAQHTLTKRNMELEKTLEMFYNIRTDFQKSQAAGKVEEQNRLMRERLDELKAQKA